MRKCLLMKDPEVVFSEQQNPLALLTEDWILKELNTHTHFKRHVASSFPLLEQYTNYLKLQGNAVPCQRIQVSIKVITKPAILRWEGVITSSAGMFQGIKHPNVLGQSQHNCSLVDKPASWRNKRQSQPHLCILSGRGGQFQTAVKPTASVEQRCIQRTVLESFIFGFGQPK